MNLTKIVDLFIERVSRRPPDFVIGGTERPYMRRWWLLRTPWFGAYLHEILRSDDDRALHDHRGDNVSVLLRGSYREVFPRPGIPDADIRGLHTSRVRLAGDVVRRRAEDLHRLEVVDGPVWTLWIKGRERREWGFRCGARWVHWQDFVAADDKGQIGRGCDQP